MQHCAVFLKVAERVDLKTFYHKKKKIVTMWWWMLTQLIEVIISQHTHLSNHCAGHLKLIQYYMSNIISIK